MTTGTRQHRCSSEPTNGLHCPFTPARKSPADALAVRNLLLQPRSDRCRGRNLHGPSVHVLRRWETPFGPVRTPEPWQARVPLSRRATADRGLRRWRAGLAVLLVFLASLGASAFAASAPAGTLFPCPAELEDAVHFWIRIYTEHDTHEYVVHDEERLGVVFDVVQVASDEERSPEFCPTPQQLKRARRVRDHYSTLLRELGSPGTDFGSLAGEKRRLVALYGNAREPRVYLLASERVRLQKGLKSRFLEGLRASGRYRDEMNRIFRAHGLPEELTVLPHVESSFNLKAYSAAGAAGVWQFTRPTGRLYLRISYEVDERMDPLLSTEAAAKLLSYNHRCLGSWPLAITAYNHGLNGMLKARKTLGTSDIGRIVRRYRSPYFGFASRNFYCEFLAALHTVKNADAYFGVVAYDPPFRFRETPVPGYLKFSALADRMGLDPGSLEELNPALREPVLTGRRYVPRGYRLRVPAHQDPEALLAAIPASEVYAEQKASRWYRVRKGDTLGRIAHEQGTTVSRLLAANEIGKPHRLRAGDVIRLPARPGGDSTEQAGETRSESLPAVPAAKEIVEASLFPAADASTVLASARAPEPQAGSDSETAAGLRPRDLDMELVKSKAPAVGIIRVEPDETLGHYADWLKVPIRRVLSWNRLRPGASVNTGQWIKLVFEKVTPDQFHTIRLEYHRGIEEDFFENYRVDKTFPHRMQKGENLWYLCNQVYNVPYWLVKRYNDEVDLAEIKPGDVVQIPEVSKTEKTS